VKSGEKLTSRLISEEKSVLSSLRGTGMNVLAGVDLVGLITFEGSSFQSLFSGMLRRRWVAGSLDLEINIANHFYYSLNIDYAFI
jgi:hypothetical protein